MPACDNVTLLTKSHSTEEKKYLFDESEKSITVKTGIGQKEECDCRAKSLSPCLGAYCA